MFHLLVITIFVNVLNYFDYLLQLLEHTAYRSFGIISNVNVLQFVVNYTLEKNIVDSPILNKTSIKHFEATFQKDCGSDDICQSQLILEAVPVLKRDGKDYIVDNITGDFVLSVKVVNEMEPAYETKLFVIHPESLGYIALKEKSENVKCSFHNKTLIICDLGNPLGAKQNVSLKLRFEIDKNTKDDRLKLDVFVNSTSIELSTTTSTTIEAVLKKIAEFKITG